jgi:hypothetical protein
VGDRVSLTSGSAELSIGDTTFRYWVFDTSDGSVDAYDGRNLATARKSAIRQGVAGDDGSGIFFSSLPQGGDWPPLAVFAIKSLTIPANMELIGVGTGALVLLVDGEVAIHGTLSVAAETLSNTSAPGAGGGHGALCAVAPILPGQGAAGTLDIGAGGGGGFGGVGGAGGAPNGGLAGAIFGDIALSPLGAGAAGGCGTESQSVFTPNGGHGGGAAHIVSAIRIVIGASGIVNASGGGGHGVNATGGGGGGSGGAILLEAPVVEVEGYLGANGGGGGGGACCDAWGPTNGANGSPRTPSAPGGRSVPNSLSGGSGSDSAGTGEAGAPADFYQPATGGGGGGGRIRINTLTGTEAYSTAGILPTLASGLATVGQVAVAP